MPLAMIIFVALAVFVALAIAHVIEFIPPGWSQRAPDESLRQQSALEILNQRFARGEIDRPEYEERRHLIV